MKKKPETELQRLLPRVVKAIVSDKSNPEKYSLELGMCIAYSECISREIRITFDKGKNTEHCQLYHAADLILTLRNMAEGLNLFSIDYDRKKTLPKG